MDEIEKIAKMISDTLSTELNVKVYISIGTVVSDLKDVSRSYKEAKMALEVGKIFETINILSIIEKLRYRQTYLSASLLSTYRSTGPYSPFLPDRSYVSSSTYRVVVNVPYVRTTY